MHYSTILITGCGGEIGCGIAKIIKMSHAADRMVGCDIHTEHPGTAFFDPCYVVPRVGADDYIEQLLELIRNEEIDLVIVASEPELRFFLQANIIGQIANVPMIHANTEAMKIGFDKLITADFLKLSELPNPWTQIVEEGLPPELPCIIKSRAGAGSKNVSIVESEWVQYYMDKRPHDIWQEYLRPDDEEYTCGLYRTQLDEIRCIVIKRKLQGGFTVYGEVIHDREIEQLLHKLALSLELRGSINVQLRLTENGPVIFEINPRFSSTVVFRHLLGFKDVIWSLTEQNGEPLEEYTPPDAGIRFYRSSLEIVMPI